jgi:hypothetical protein
VAAVRIHPVERGTSKCERSELTLPLADEYVDHHT